MFNYDDECYSLYIENGRQIQDALLDITGQSTVPNVFIKGIPEIFICFDWPKRNLLFFPFFVQENTLAVLPIWIVSGRRANLKNF